MFQPKKNFSITHLKLQDNRNGCYYLLCRDEKSETQRIQVIFPKIQVKKLEFNTSFAETSVASI